MRSSELELDQDSLESPDFEFEPDRECEPCVLRERDRVRDRWWDIDLPMPFFPFFLLTLPRLLLPETR